MAQIVPLFKKNEAKKIDSNNEDRQSDKFSLFHVEEKVFAIPAVELAEIADYSSVIEIPQKSDIITGVVNVRSNVIPIINIREKLGLIPDFYVNDKTKIIYFYSRQKFLLGMIVDEVEFKLIDGYVLEDTKTFSKFGDKDFRPAVMEENGKNRRFQVFSIDDYLRTDDFYEIHKVIDSF